MRTLREFWNRHPDAEQPLRAWYREAKAAKWSSPHDVKAMYRNSSIVGNSRVVFNIAGNKYRLVAKCNYEHQFAYIEFVGTHAEYDRINVDTV